MSATEAFAARKSIDGLLPLCTGIAVYILLLAAGNALLNDPDTYWQIRVGQSIFQDRAVPYVDAYSFTMKGQYWISTQWLAQVLFARAYEVAGWAGPVVLAAASAALAVALLAHFLEKRLSQTTTLVLVSAALVLTAAHMLARPHILAMPVMVAWVAGLVDAMDRKSAPSFWLLPLMILWANLHGGFVLGLALLGLIALDTIWHAPTLVRARLVKRWALFGVAALAASCATPYGWETLMASHRILSLGAALTVIGEWRPSNFGRPGPLEFAVLGALAVVLWRGLILPPMRIVLVVGFVYMALSHVRNAEVLALLGPLVLAKPLGEQFGRDGADAGATLRRSLLAVIALCLVAVTLIVASFQQYRPTEHAAPAAAVDKLKELKLSRVFNDYEFGGYLIWRGVPTFIDGRAELFGEKLVVDHSNASRLIEPDVLFRMLEDYNIDATLMPTDSAVAKLLDRIDGWERVYRDNGATIHARKHHATHSAIPAVNANMR